MASLLQQERLTQGYQPIMDESVLLAINSQLRQVKWAKRAVKRTDRV